MAAAALAIIAASGCATAVAGTPVAAAVPAVESAPEPPPPTDLPSTPTPPPAPPPPTPCELLPQAEAEELAGTPLDEPVLIDTGGYATCTYSGPTDGPVAQVEIFFGPGAQKYLDVERRLGHEETPVAEIGDEAYLVQKTVFFRVGDDWVSIRLVRLEPAEKYAAGLVVAARKAIARM